jgi:hypothetical protein
MTILKYILSAITLSLVTPTLADKTFTEDEQKKIDYLVDHPDKLKKLEALPESKRQKAFEKFDLTQEEYDTAKGKTTK